MTRSTQPDPRRSTGIGEGSEQLINDNAEQYEQKPHNEGNHDDPPRDHPFG